MLPSSYRPISLKGTKGKLVDRFLLPEVFRELRSAACYVTSISGSDAHTARHCTWPALLKESIEILKGGDWQAPFSCMWPKPLSLMGRSPPIQAHYPDYRPTC
jgi:hypothetical protein